AQCLIRQRRHNDPLQRLASRVHRYATALMMMFAITLIACGGGVDIPEPSTPVITVQPADTSVVVGNSATLSVTVTGLNPSYQWQISTDAGLTWSDILSATQASYTIDTVTNLDNGKRFRVKVTAAGTSITSSAIQLTVTAAPVAAAITVQPTSQSVTAPAAASFSVTATGTALAYQWQRCADANATCATWTNLAGATAASHTIAATDVAMNGQRFQVVVSNSLGSVSSVVATLNVAATPAAPIFTTQPVSVTIASGQTTSFTVAVSGMPTPTLQWQLSTDSGVTWSNIAGGNSSPLTIVGTLSDSGRQYRAVATNSISTATSNVATLTVNPAPILPAFTTQPASVSVTEGGNTSFTVAVSGTPTPTLQWQLSTNSGVNWSNIVGETGNILNVVGAALANNDRQFRAVATNSAGSVNSNAATLTVNAAPPPGLPSFTTHPANVTVIAGQNASFTAVVGGTPTPTLQWQLRNNSFASWGNLSSETNPTLNIATTTLAQNGFQFRVVATNSAGVTNSNVATLTVNPVPPSVTWQTAQLLETDTVNAGSNPQVAFNVAGEGMAVWSQANSTVGGIWSSHYVAATGWGAATLIAAMPTLSGGLPQVVMDASGNATVVWQQFDTEQCINIFGFSNPCTGYNVWASRYVAGAGWGTPTKIENNSPDKTFDELPQIAVDVNGNVIAVWESTSFTATTVWANRYVIGTGWGTASQIGSGNTNSVSVNPQVAIDGSGNGFVVWSQYNGSILNIWSNRFAVGAGWGAAALISDSTMSSRDPRIAADVNGNAIAVWGQFNLATSAHDIFANRFVAGIGWGTATVIQANSVKNNAYRPKIAFDSAGNAMVAWSQMGRIGPYSIWANRYVAGSGWGAETLIETDNAGHASNVSMGMDGSGNAIAVWEQADANGFTEIYSNRYVVGMGWGTVALVEPGNKRTGQANLPQIAVNPNGKALAVWQRYNGGGGISSIWGNATQ
ncbi:MAG: hypothetical protein ABL902_10345, partial [Gallionella sp.]